MSAFLTLSNLLTPSILLKTSIWATCSYEATIFAGFPLLELLHSVRTPEVIITPRTYAQGGLSNRLRLSVGQSVSRYRISVWSDYLRFGPPRWIRTGENNLASIFHSVDVGGFDEHGAYAEQFPSLAALPGIRHFVCVL